jgi:3-methyl-2-oxobutanoate hydroxymethyltransferase
MTVAAIRARKGGEPIVCLTAYSALMAEILDPFVDLLLVGDSVGTVHHGHETTLPVTVEHMILHAASVARTNPNALIVVDIPFGAFESSAARAFETSARILKETGADAVKIEGGVAQASTIEFLAKRGVPVMAHIGLRPQMVKTTGGYRIVGKTKEERLRLHEDARAVTEAGAFAVVLEGVIESLAEEITKQIAIPTIGIGASPQCDGQVLVTEDMLGLFEKTPKFVRKFAELRPIIAQAIAEYATAVRDRAFPSKDETYSGDRPTIPLPVKNAGG